MCIPYVKNFLTEEHREAPRTQTCFLVCTSPMPLSLSLKGLNSVFLGDLTVQGDEVSLALQVACPE